MNSNVAIIIPAYNEEQTIKETILSFFNELPNAKIVVVNNNSTDKTEEISLDTFQEYRINGSVLNETTQGKGNAVRYAFRKIEAEVFIMTDADMTYPANEVHKLIEPIVTEDIDMVVGDRISSGLYKEENKRALHNFGNKLVSR